MHAHNHNSQWVYKHHVLPHERGTRYSIHCVHGLDQMHDHQL